MSETIDFIDMIPEDLEIGGGQDNHDTEFYSLNEFSEHHTKDIRKGYLNGRYGAIPFLGNFQKLITDKDAQP